MSKSISPRPNYLSTPNADRAAYLRTQGDMFGAARAKGLPVQGDDRARMVNAIARYLEDKNITSRQQLEPIEFQVVTVAIERGYFSPEWLLNPQAHNAATLRSMIETEARRAREAAARLATARANFDYDSIID